MLCTAQRKGYCHELKMAEQIFNYCLLQLPGCSSAELNEILLTLARIRQHITQIPSSSIRD